jgi:carboxypeptidase family protein
MTLAGFHPFRISRGVLAACLVLAAAVGAFAQQDAGIIGVVSDESGGVLPGVTVTVTGPSLQVPSMSAVTDTKGEYRITPLPIGTYTVEYALTGFQSVKREGIRLTVGFTAKVDTQLKVGSLEETITVSGASPVVDTHSTTTTTQLTRETIELLPSSRNGVVSLLAQAPGVRTLRDVGGSSLNSVPTFRVFGQPGEAYSTLEGVWTSSLQQSSGQANYWDYTSLEEASVRTIGNGAEVPSRGVTLNAVIKSGGNDFHGSGWGNLSGKHFQGNNIDSALESQGIKQPDATDTRYSYSGDLGGRIVRDKLWFYTSGRYQVDNHYALNTFMPDGVTPAVADVNAWFQTDKAQYQLSSSNRITGFWMHNHKLQTSGLSQFIPYNDRNGLYTFSDTRKIEWQKTFSNTLVTDVQVGGFQYHDHLGWSFARNNGDIIPTVDLATQQTTGPPVSNGERPIVPRQHVKATGTWYKPDLFKGNHEFKFGFDYANANYGRQYPIVDPSVKEPNGAYSSYVVDYQLQYTRSVPTRLVVQNLPAAAWVADHYTGLYLQDSWTVGRLTANLGVRYAHDNGFIPASCRQAALPPADVAFPAQCFPKQQFNIWNPVVPRLYASYDLAGNGKTVIKAGWGRFAHERQHVPELDGSDPQVRTQVTYTWHDLNGNRLYEPGEVNLDVNGPDFVSQAAGSNRIANPNEQEPMSDEVSVSLERELIPNFAIRASGVYSRTESYRLANVFRPYSAYNIPITNQDPGPDGVFGTADDTGTPITYYEYPTNLAGRAFEQYMLTNDPNATQSFKSLEIAAAKRYAQKWELMASFSATKRNIPITGAMVGGTAVATGVASAAQEFNSNTLVGDNNPDAEINAADHTWEWNGKGSGAFTLPYEVLVSVNYEHRGGYAYARSLLISKAAGFANVGKTIPQVAVLAEPIGTRRLPNTNQTDVRFEKAFPVNKSQKVSARLNIFNVFNANTITDVIRQSGPTFLRPTSIMAPRIMEISASYQF